MKRKTLDKILKYFREEMVANAPGAQGGFGNAGTNEKGNAGFDPPMKKKPLRRKKIIGLGPGSRKRWSKTHRITEGEIADKLRKVVADMKAADRKAGLLPGGKDVIDLDVERERRRKKKK